MDALLFLCQLLVGAILLMSASLKFLDLAGFTDTIRRYAIVPNSLAPAVALAVPTLELLSGVSLVTGEAARPGAWLAVVLFAVFMAAVSINIRRGVNLECGCFGLLWREQTGWPTVIRDAILLSASLGVAIAGPGVVLREVLSGRDDAADLVPLVLVVLVLSMAALTVITTVRAERAVAPPTATADNLPPPDPALS